MPTITYTLDDGFGTPDAEIDLWWQPVSPHGESGALVVSGPPKTITSKVGTPTTITNIAATQWRITGLGAYLNESVTIDIPEAGGDVTDRIKAAISIPPGTPVSTLVQAAKTATEIALDELEVPSKEELDATYAPSNVGQYELQTMFATGHSWLGSQSFTTPSARYHERVARRLGMGAITNQAVAGRTIGDIANLTLGGARAWVPRTKSLVTAICTINDLTLLPANAATRRGYGYAWRALLSMLTANAAVAANTPSFGYNGAWSTESVSGVATDPAGAIVNSTGGVRWKTSTVGDSVDIAFTGPDCDLILVARAAGAGLVTVTEGATTLGTLDLTAATTQDCPAVFRIRNRGAGAHTVRATLTSGASLTIDSYRQPSTAPVPILVLGEPPVIPAGGDSPTYLADLAAFKADLAAICADYPSARFIDLAQPDWDQDSMLSPDGKHPNDAGAAWIAGKAVAALVAMPYSVGLNVVPGTYPAAYSAPTTPLVFGSQDGVTASGLTATPGDTEVALDWSRLVVPAGTTDFTVQYRTSPAGSWQTFAHSASTATSIDVTGLTNLTAYDFRVAPVVGGVTGTFSRTVTSTPTEPPTVYAADTFTRANSADLGTTEVGGYTWARNNGSTMWTILDNQLDRAAGSGVSADDIWIDAGHANGSIKAKLALAGFGYGLVFRLAGATHATGYVFYRSSASQYRLSKRTGVGSYTELQSVAVTPQAGDDAEVVFNGSAIKCFVNGVKVIDLTDSSYTGTMHGVWANSGVAARIDSFEHTNYLG
ncbi:major tail protein [Gordonia phage Beenie]|uniref:Minor tail protein n=1 Tax=Gordonia phage Beenie TaxID=2079397 RepID=A0A2K9VH04_9CAUD|nr:major tail protein [Gordonia phage Beenie]AUV61592.1 minor tail protein [Gordonia phage Beenie]